MWPSQIATIANQRKADKFNWQWLKEFTKDTGNFLNDYDEIVLHKEFYRSLFVYTLVRLRRHVVELLQKFVELPTDRTDEKAIACCGELFTENADFKAHYQTRHNKRVLQSASLCELKMALAKLTFFERSIADYKGAGKYSNCEMIFNLKKILRRLDLTLMF